MRRRRSGRAAGVVASGGKRPQTVQKPVRRDAFHLHDAIEVLCLADDLRCGVERLPKLKRIPACTAVRDNTDLKGGVLQLANVTGAAAAGRKRCEHLERIVRHHGFRIAAEHGACFIL